VQEERGKKKKTKNKKGDERRREMQEGRKLASTEKSCARLQKFKEN